MGMFVKLLICANFDALCADCSLSQYHDVRHIAAHLWQLALLSLLILPPQTRGQLHARFLVLRHDPAVLT